MSTTDFGVWFWCTGVRPKNEHKATKSSVMSTPCNSDTKADCYWKVVQDFLALNNNIMMDNKFGGPTAMQTLAIHLIVILPTNQISGEKTDGREKSSFFTLPNARLYLNIKKWLIVIRTRHHCQFWSGASFFVLFQGVEKSHIIFILQRKNLLKARDTDLNFSLERKFEPFKIIFGDNHLWWISWEFSEKICEANSMHS